MYLVICKRPSEFYYSKMYYIFVSLRVVGSVVNFHNWAAGEPNGDGDCTEIFTGADPVKME